MPETQYRSSDGSWKDIATMNFNNMVNAAKKLRASGDQPAALEAMDARIASMQADYRLTQNAIINDPAATEEERTKARLALAKLDASQ